jgi:hypothetical protein
MVQLVATTFKRKSVGRKYKGTVLFMKMLQHDVMPEKVHNYYVCAKNRSTAVQYVRVQDLCTLLAEVPDRAGDANKVNLVPICHAFPVSWIAD